MHTNFSSFLRYFLLHFFIQWKKFVLLMFCTVVTIYYSNLSKMSEKSKSSKKKKIQNINETYIGETHSDIDETTNKISPSLRNKDTGWTISYNEEADIHEHANNIVKYIICTGGSHKVYKKNDFLKVIPNHGKQFEQIIKITTEILENVYGYNLKILDSPKVSQKSYIVSNSLPYKEIKESTTNKVPDDANKILIMLVLTHIFMSKNNVTYDSLLEFLKKFSIDVDKEHVIFGNVKNDILNTMVKLKYINIQTDAITTKMIFSWGLRAEKEISKLKILEFVCKIYKEGKEEYWGNQFRDATRQSLKL